MTSLTDIFNQDFFNSHGAEAEIDYDVTIENVIQYLIDNRQNRDFDYAVPFNAAVPSSLRRGDDFTSSINNHRSYLNRFKQSANTSDLFCSKLITTLPTFKTSSAKYI